MRTYVLYQRINAFHPEKFAWQIELHEKKKKPKVIEATSYKEPIPLEDFAREVARNPNQRINPHDLLTTISAPVCLPVNEYVDEPVTGGQLAHFWRVYDLELGRLKG